MNEVYYYHSIATAAHGSYGRIKKYQAMGGGSWEVAYNTLRDNAAELMEDGVALPDPREAYERMQSFDVRLVLDSENEFPEALRHISHPPFGVYLRGAALSAAPTLAVVGTRRASADGKKTARHFARELAAAGFVIASGLAFGIDAAAHEGALDANGTTIAILAGGLDGIYPRSHRALAERILEHGGTLISEYPPGEEAFAYRFIERNRIISGISRGVLIVEAPESSGALATARYAVDQNREVFVIPGGVTATNFKGSHALIRQGAELVTSPDDILDAYDMDKKTNAAVRAITSSPEETLILKALGEISAPIDVDKLVIMTKLEPRIVNQTLSLLIIGGIVKESDGGYTI
ncbi:MAG TPA: DNA-processing protein DprA [Candidatus Paceibacterota bacterium]|nr:DNA-processing protein DprA [Candidatus Paceibacterota bacterium]